MSDAKPPRPYADGHLHHKPRKGEGALIDCDECLAYIAELEANLGDAERLFRDATGFTLDEALKQENDAIERAEARRTQEAKAHAD